MLTWLQLSLQALVALTVFCLILPATLSMSLLANLKSFQQLQEGSWEKRLVLPSFGRTDGSEKIMAPSFAKRSAPGTDAWSLCPSRMERIDCFYEYLRVYARLRKAAAQSDSVSVRNIGKRSETGELYTSDLDPCPEGWTSCADLLYVNPSLGKLV